MGLYEKIMARAILAEFGKDDVKVAESAKRYADMLSLLSAITGHPTFFCPLTGKCLDVRTAKMIVVEDSDDKLLLKKVYGPDADVEALVAGVRDKVARSGHNLTVRVINGADYDWPED